jgi:hypothetical protein
MYAAKKEAAELKNAVTIAQQQLGSEAQEHIKLRDRYISETSSATKEIGELKGSLEALSKLKGQHQELEKQFRDAQIEAEKAEEGLKAQQAELSKMSKDMQAQEGLKAQDKHLIQTLQNENSETKVFVFQTWISYKYRR